MSQERTSSRGLWLTFALVLVGVGLFLWFLDRDPPPPTPSAADAGSSPPEYADPVPVAPPERTAYDPERLARTLLDGSTAAQAEEAAAIYAPEPPTRGVEEPEEVARARMEEAAAAAAEAPAPPREPGTPAQQLRQATFWRGLLDTRVEAMREQQREAEARGDAAAARRAARIIERLEGERPSIDGRIDTLRREVEPDAP